MFERLAGPSQRGLEDHLPHVAVHMMDPGDPGTACPDGGEERNPVPDLDETVAPTVPADDLAQDSIGDHAEAPAAAHDAVPIASGTLRVSLRVRGPHGDLEARIGPELQDPVGVEFGSPRLDVDEIAPCQHVDPAEVGLGGQGGDVGDAGARGRHAGVSRAVRGWDARGRTNPGR